MVVNVVALASFVVIAVVGALPVAGVPVAVVAVVGNRASIQRRRDMAPSNLAPHFRSGRKSRSRDSCLVFVASCLIRVLFSSRAILLFRLFSFFKRCVCFDVLGLFAKVVKSHGNRQKGRILHNNSRQSYLLHTCLDFN